MRVLLKVFCLVFIAATSSAAFADTLSGILTLSATADDNVGVVGVQFQLDGVNLGQELQSYPYTLQWNSTTVSDGNHTISATARDAAGNRGSVATTISVSNGVAQLPVAFGKGNPSNGGGSLSTSLNLSWGASSGNTSFEYCVDTTNNASCDTGWASTAGTSATISGLNSGTTYWWQVRARNGAGVTEANNGAWWSFTTSVPGRINFAAAANGATATASSVYNAGYGASGAIDGDRAGLRWSNSGGWNDATPNAFPDWLEVDFASPQVINEIDVFTVQDNFSNPVDPSLAQTFTQLGLTAFQAQYWDGSNWTTVSGGNISGNNNVWRQITFSALSTRRIRVLVMGALNGFSRITEIEAYGNSNGGASIPPSALTKTSPANAATAQPVSPTLSWGTSNGATSYEYCVDTTNNNSCDTTWTSTSSTSVTVGGLNSGMTYFWQVRARNSNGTIDADVGAWWTFTTSFGGRINVASSANGATATASSSFSMQYGPELAINGERRGTNWGNGGGWNDSTANAYPDWLQVDFASPQTISEIDVFTLQDAFNTPVEPSANQTFTLYGLTSFQVQYWNGLTWIVVPGGDISGNNQVWRQFTFSPFITSRIRVFVTGALNSFSRITELEAYSESVTIPGSFAKVSPANIVNAQTNSPTLTWGTSSGASSYEYCVDTINNNTCDTSWTTTPGTSLLLSAASNTTYYWQVRARNGNGTTDADNGSWWSFSTGSGGTSRQNVAAAANGGTATASSTYSAAFSPAGAIDGDRKGVVWGNGGGWNDATPGIFPDWLQIVFSGSKVISEIDIFTVPDKFTTPVDPTPSMTFTQYGITDFQVQYWDGAKWVDLPNGTITGNNLVWRQISFPPVSTSNIRIVVNGALSSSSRIVEVEAY